MTKPTMQSGGRRATRLGLGTVLSRTQEAPEPKDAPAAPAAEKAIRDALSGAPAAPRSGSRMAAGARRTQEPAKAAPGGIHAPWLGIYRAERE